jgi:hypothetical protein
VRKRASVPDRTGLTAWRGHTFRDDAAVAVRIYLALGDSISIDDYTGVRGGGAPSQLAQNASRMLRSEIARVQAFCKHPASAAMSPYSA